MVSLKSFVRAIVTPLAVSGAYSPASALLQQQCASWRFLVPPASVYKNKCPFRSGPTIADRCRIGWQPCNTPPNPAGMAPVTRKTRPLLPTVGSKSTTWHDKSLPRWRERSILDATGNFRARQSNSPWVSPTGGARFSGKTLGSLVSTFCLR